MEIKNLKHLSDLVEGCCTENIRLDLEDGKLLILQHEAAKEATIEILERYNLRSVASKNLL